MQEKRYLTTRLIVGLCALAFAGVCGVAQDEGELTAKQRVFRDIGPGLRAIKRGADGNYYILSAPGAGVVVFNATGKELKKVPGYAGNEGPANAELRAIGFGEDMDVDAAGTVYVADPRSNAVKVWDSKGNARLISVNSPVSVAAMPEGEVGVATLHEPHLVIVFDTNGRDVREFGDPEPISQRAELNRFLNIGRLASDEQGHVYYAFEYFPEPTVRQYDRHGYAGQDFQYTAIEALTTARAVRREIDKQESRGDAPTFKRVLTAVGVERATGEVWIALHNTLLHFDKKGNRRASYQLYTAEGARLDASTILVEKERLLIGSDPLGVYEFERPDKKLSE
jgi:hypothetical protein